MASITLKSNNNSSIYLGNSTDKKIIDLIEKEATERKSADEELQANIDTKVDFDEIPAIVRTTIPTVETALSTTNTLSLNTIYDLGMQTNISLNLPIANVGNFIQVDFLSGSTATTVEISATSSALMSDFDFTPSPNMIYSMFFDYGVLDYDSTNSTYIYGWRFSYAEYTYTEE